MATYSSIQWCDGTINPVSGCEGCELYEMPNQFVARVAAALPGDPIVNRRQVAAVLERFDHLQPKQAALETLQALNREGTT